MTDAPRRPHGFWVILAGNTPTSFRARAREVLVPTFVQLQRTQPDVSLKWFERGRIWTSPAEARDALLAQRQQPRRREHAPDWRPGGDHKDPRKRFELSRDQKRARFKARQRVDPDRAASRQPESDHGPDKRGSGARWPSPPGSRGPSAGSRSRRPPGRPGTGPGRSGPRKPGGSRGPR
jgi:hypothetical protein